MGALIALYDYLCNRHGIVIHEIRLHLSLIFFCIRKRPDRINQIFFIVLNAEH